MSKLMSYDKEGVSLWKKTKPVVGGVEEFARELNLISNAGTKSEDSLWR